MFSNQQSLHRFFLGGDGHARVQSKRIIPNIPPNNVDLDVYIRLLQVTEFAQKPFLAIPHLKESIVSETFFLDTQQSEFRRKSTQTCPSKSDKI